MSIADARDAFPDLSSVADLARCSPALRDRCIQIAEVVDRVNADPDCTRANRVSRIRDCLETELGISLSVRQVYRYLARFRRRGVVGFADGRSEVRPRGSRADPRLLELIESELKELAAASTGTRSRTIARVSWEADRQGIPLPSRSTMYRLVNQLDRKRGSFGAAKTRRSKAARPDRTYHPVAVSRPGEIVEVDATPLDLFVQMPDGTVGRPELTYAVDVATSTIGATLLHAKAAKSVDIGAVLLTRMLSRVETQNWWNDAVALAMQLFDDPSGDLRQSLADAAARTPLIVPESVTIDRGKVFVGSTFTAACERLQISQVRASPRQGTDKPHVESGFKRIRDGFVQYLAGYSGGNVLDRSEKPAADALWTLGEVQLLLDLWVSIWSRERH